MHDAEDDSRRDLMSEYALSMLVYLSLQGASLAFLPKWWKLAALPSLLLVPEIIRERLHPGYMSDVLIAMVAIFACGYLLLVWIAFAVARLIISSRRNRPMMDDNAS